MKKSKISKKNILSQYPEFSEIIHTLEKAVSRFIEEEHFHNNITIKHIDSFIFLKTTILKLKKYKAENTQNLLLTLIKTLEKCDFSHIENTYLPLKECVLFLQNNKKTKHIRIICQYIYHTLEESINKLSHIFLLKQKEIEEKQREEIKKAYENTFLEKLEKQWSYSYRNVIEERLNENSIYYVFIPSARLHFALDSLTYNGLQGETIHDIIGEDYRNQLCETIHDMSLEIMQHITERINAVKNKENIFDFLSALKNLQDSPKVELNAFRDIFLIFEDTVHNSIHFFLHHQTQRIKKKILTKIRKGKESFKLEKQPSSKEMKDLYYKWSSKHFSSQYVYSKAIMDDLEFFTVFFNQLTPIDYKRLDSFKEMQEKWKQETSIFREACKEYVHFLEDFDTHQYDNFKSVVDNENIESLLKTHGKKIEKWCKLTSIELIAEFEQYTGVNTELYENTIIAKNIVNLANEYARISHISEIVNNLNRMLQRKEFEEQVFKTPPKNLEHFFYINNIIYFVPREKYKKLAALTKDVWFPGVRFEKHMGKYTCVFDISYDETPQKILGDTTLFHIDITFMGEEKTYRSSLQITKFKGLISSHNTIMTYFKNIAETFCKDGALKAQQFINTIYDIIINILEEQIIKQEQQTKLLARQAEEYLEKATNPINTIEKQTEQEILGKQWKHIEGTYYAINIDLPLEGFEGVKLLTHRESLLIAEKINYNLKPNEVLFDSQKHKNQTQKVKNATIFKTVVRENRDGKLSPVSYFKFMRVLRRIYPIVNLERGKGSHMKIIATDEEKHFHSTMISKHNTGSDIPIGTLQSMLEDLSISPSKWYQAKVKAI